MKRTGVAALMLGVCMAAIPAMAQPRMAPQQLDQLVGRIALYPDPLLAQVLTASTFWDQIPDAAGWASQHSYLTGDQLSGAIQQDNLPWDPSVLALLPFPSVLDTMAQDPSWTQALGNAVLGQRDDVMDAVQRMRAQAMNYGYLQSGPQYRVVNQPGDIEILPVDPSYIYVPRYDPRVVFVGPRRGAFIGLSFGPRVVIGASFAPYGWRNSGFGWRDHTIVIDHHPWQRTVQNRGTYQHQYAQPIRRPNVGGRPPARVERHDVAKHQPQRHDDKGKDRHDKKDDHDRH